MFLLVLYKLIIFRIDILLITIPPIPKGAWDDTKLIPLLICISVDEPRFGFAAVPFHCGSGSLRFMCLHVHLSSFHTVQVQFSRTQTYIYIYIYTYIYKPAYGSGALWGTTFPPGGPRHCARLLGMGGGIGGSGVKKNNKSKNDPQNNRGARFC